MRLAVFIPTLQGGGAERAMSIVARGFAERGHQVDLLVASSEGPYRQTIPPEVRLIEFGRRGVMGCLMPLARYLRTERPDALYSAMSHANVVALIANRLAGNPARVIVSERTSFVSAKRHIRSPRNRVVRMAMRMTYRSAHRVVVVARAIVDELHWSLGLDKSRIAAIPNPVVPTDLAALAAEQPASAVFSSGRPVILAAGRLAPEKDFGSLIRAFALVRQRHDGLLAIIGEGPELPALKELVRELGLTDHVEMPGFVSNPFAWMRSAQVFVLSSRFEGMPGVLIQAMACGTPVVSTDCRTGPSEILEDGRWGALVPVGDETKLADAISASLERTDHPDVAVRARYFSEENAVDAYLDLARVSDRPS